MMKKRQSACLLSLGILSLAPALSAAAEPTERLCNLQGRELALRAAETLFPGLDTVSRQELALLAEKTCLDYAGLQAAGDGPAPEVSGLVEAPAEDTDDEGFGEFLNDITIIEPQDRVRRPGLKRP